MELIPVLDLMQGEVVRGRAGNRGQYQPNISGLTPGSDPVQTVLAFKEAFHPNWLYIADLDAIRHGHAPHPVISTMIECGIPLAVDAGVSSVQQAETLIEMGVGKVIIGLETLPQLDLLGPIISSVGSDRIVFSLDLRDGQPLGAGTEGMHPAHILSIAVECGVRHVIVLEFSHIGTSRGVPTGAFCHTVKERRPDLIVWTGGGVRHVADLHRLQLARVDGAMVASALHDGLITPADWQSYQTMEVDSTLLAMDA
ncbi:MAG TPA: HisA/HisF-related TIM barrel protein [Planctomicrobium sp.]|nr:HisA/HisF-related TIM barrel protein [Planctomicrobium sp.]